MVSQLFVDEININGIDFRRYHAVEVETKIKVIMGIVGVLAAGFIGFRLLKAQSPDIEETQICSQGSQARGQTNHDVSVC